MPHFICPNCGNRSLSSERTAGFRREARGCSNCGFGFLFELLDDYYPAPNAAFFICDQQARLIGAGRGSRELTGLGDEDVIGRPVQEVLGLVAAMFVAAVAIIASKPTRLGLDLKGGVELVYQARPTPQVPKVTPQAIDDAVNTIRKRTDALGVSEPEIQRSGSDQISIGLPAVKNANRAEAQVGTTAQLQFYDWEPNLIGSNGKYLLPDPPNDSTLINSNPLIVGLFPAVEAASKAQPKAEPNDIPPGGPSKQVVATYHGNQKQIEAYYDRKNDTSGTKYYVFAPGKANARPVLRPGEAGLQRAGFTPGVNDANSFYTSCQDLANDYLGASPTTGPRARGPKVPLQTQPQGTAGPP